MTGNQTITCLSARSITADATLQDFLHGCKPKQTRQGVKNNYLYCMHNLRVGLFPWMRMGEILLSLLERCNNKIEISLFYFLSLSLFLFVGWQVPSTFNDRIANTRMPLSTIVGRRLTQLKDANTPRHAGVSRTIDCTAFTPYGRGCFHWLQWGKSY